MKENKSGSSKTLPLVVIIGPTNVGKSTLFNRITGTFQAVTAREESTTRDRIFGEAEWQGFHFNLIDTGGLADDKSELYGSIKEQTEQAIEEADLLLFLYDARDGLKDPDAQYLNRLRGKDVILVGNKVDTQTLREQTEQKGYLGFPFQLISAATGKGVGDLMEEIVRHIPKFEASKIELPLIAIIGRPNVGKSSLLNALTKDNRAVVSEVAGTTRDVVKHQLKIGDQTFLLADTAGVRRRGKIQVGVEKFSVKRSLTTIAESDAVIVILDASEGLARGDLHLIYYAKGLKKPILLVLNKIDLLNNERRPDYDETKKFPVAQVSAKTGQNLGEIIKWVKSVFRDRPQQF